MDGFSHIAVAGLKNVGLWPAAVYAEGGLDVGNADIRVSVVETVSAGRLRLVGGELPGTGGII